MKALELTNYIINKANNFGINIDHLKLQKLLYYIQGYTLSEFDFPAFEDDIEHWDHGPVVRNVYHYYKDMSPTELVPTTIIKEPKIPIICVCNAVLKVCNKLSSVTLSKMTHDEDPWKNTIRNEILEKEIIKNYFKLENPLNLNSNDFELSDEEYKKFSDYILERDKEIFKALS